MSGAYSWQDCAKAYADGKNAERDRIRTKVEALPRDHVDYGHFVNVHEVLAVVDPITEEDE